MIKYQLRCSSEHEFEGWFRNSADFDSQSADGLLTCPACGSGEVAKAIMAPAVSTGSAGREGRLREIRGAMAEAAKRARDYVEKNFEYVGPKFPEEARKIHYGETGERRIYGEATGREAKELVDEGVDIAPLPAAPREGAAGPAKPVIERAKKPAEPAE